MKVESNKTTSRFALSRQGEVLRRPTLSLSLSRFVTIFATVAVVFALIISPFQSETARATTTVTNTYDTAQTVTIPAAASNIKIDVAGAGGGSGGGRYSVGSVNTSRTTGAGGNGGRVTKSFSGGGFSLTISQIGAPGAGGTASSSAATNGGGGTATIATTSNGLTMQGNGGGGGQCLLTVLGGSGSSGSCANNAPSPGDPGGGSISDGSVTPVSGGGAAGGASVTVPFGSTLNGNPGGRGYVRVTYTLPDPPTITGLNPATGLTAGGETVAVYGTDFVNGGTTVVFGTETATCSFVSVGELSCVTPPHLVAEAVDVVATTDVGSSSAFVFTYAEPTLEITSVDPDEGLTVGGTEVTVRGAGFVEDDTTVEFGGEEAECGFVSEAELTCITPAHAKGEVDVVVTLGGGDTDDLPLGFTYVEPSISLTLDKNAISMTGLPGNLLTDHLTATVETDNPKGYHLEVSASNVDLVCADDNTKKILALDNTSFSPGTDFGPMVDNHWGFGVDPDPLSPSTPTGWRGVSSDTPFTVRDLAAATVGDDTVLWFGTRVDYSLPACKYGGSATITALVNF